LNGCLYFSCYLQAEPASTCILQPDIAVIRLDFPLTPFADGGNIFPLFSRLFNGNVMGARF
jgi:hypothetical protein